MNRLTWKEDARNRAHAAITALKGNPVAYRLDLDFKDAQMRFANVHGAVVIENMIAGHPHAWRRPLSRAADLIDELLGAIARWRFNGKRGQR